MDTSELGSRITAARKQQRLTQAALAARADVSRQTVVALEAGRNPEAGLATILRVLHALGLDLVVTDTNASVLPTRADLHAHRERVLRR